MFVHLALERVILLNLLLPQSFKVEALMVTLNSEVASDLLGKTF